MRYDISEIGETIRTIQKRHTMNQKDFADMIGINVGTLSKWIRGETFQNLIGLLTICDLCDAKITDFIKPMKSQ